MTSLSHADKWYKAQCEAQREADRTQSKIDPKWHEKVTHEMARLHDSGCFANPNMRTANENDRRYKEPVIVETVDDDSDEDTDDEFDVINDDPVDSNAKEQNISNEQVTMDTTTMTDDDTKPNKEMRSFFSMEIHRALDLQERLLMDRVQELAAENAVLRSQNAKKNRIIEILMEDFKVMDINDAYFTDGRIK
jgi:hypothetical protein